MTHLAFALLALVPAFRSVPVQAAETEWTQGELEEMAREIQRQVEVVRGARFRSDVRVALCGQEELLAYAERRLAQLETPEALSADEDVLQMLGLLPAGKGYREQMLAVLEGQVGGFYDPPSDTFYLMRRFGKGGAARIILAHELGHALDDQVHDLDAKLAATTRTTDAELAFHALVEGSGMAAMNGWMRAHPGAWTAQDLQAAVDMTSDSLAEAPAVVWKPMLGAYWLGDAFLRRSDKFLNASLAVPTNEDVAQAFAALPLSTEQVLHPEKYWSSATLDRPRTVAVALTNEDLGWRLLATDTLGELVIALTSARPVERGGLSLDDPSAVLGLKFTSPAARGWGGDGLALFGREQARLLHWVTVWDSAADAAEFAAAMDALAADRARWLGEVAAAHGLAGATGSLVVHEADSDRVDVTIWCGVGADEARTVVAGTRATIEPVAR